MVKHYNPSLSEDIGRTLNTKAGDHMSADVSGPIVTIPINRYANILREAFRSTSGASTIFTTPSDKDFYLTSVGFNFVKDATCDVASATNVGISVVIDGSTRNIELGAFLTLTAQSHTANIAFTRPIKIDRGTSILLISNTFTVGSLIRTGHISGYTVEVTKGI